MAIDPTRGLPSFSEMYGAFKNRGGLGQALQAGVEGYTQGVNLGLKDKEVTADAEYKRAQAEELKRKLNAGPGGVPVQVLATMGFTPEEVETLRGQFPEGRIPESIFGPTVTNRAGTLKSREQLELAERSEIQRQAFQKAEREAAQAHTRGMQEAAQKAASEKARNEAIAKVVEGKILFTTMPPDQVILVTKILQDAARQEKLAEIVGSFSPRPTLEQIQKAAIKLGIDLTDASAGINPLDKEVGVTGDDGGWSATKVGN